MRRRNAVYVRRNVKRVAWHVAIGVGLFFAVRLVWGWQADREHARLAKAIEAKGVSLDFTPQAPGPDDPELMLADAVAPAGAVSRADVELLENGDALDPEKLEWNKPQDRVRASAALAKLTPAFDAFGAMTSLKKGPHFIASDSLIRQCNLFGRLLLADGVLHAENHDEAKAFHRFGQVLTLSRLLQDDQTELGLLVGIAFRARVARAVEQLQPDLRLEDTASRGGAGAIVRTLIDAQALKAKGGQASLGDVNYLQWTFTFKLPALRGWWLRPFRVSELNGTMRQEMGMAPYFLKADFRGARREDSKIASPVFLPGSILDEVAHRYSSGTVSRAVLMECRCISDSAGAAMLLAAQMYKQKHGHYPAAAEDMVPELLGKVPVDPFDPAGGAMRYRLDVDGPTVWSVNENGTDEHAAIRFEYGKREQRYDRQPDLVYGSAWRDAAAGPSKGPSAPK